MKKIPMAKLLKYAAYYTAAASIYNYAVNAYIASAGAAAVTGIPLLPNPALAVVTSVLGVNAPLALTQSTGGYGWG